MLNLNNYCKSYIWDTEPVFCFTSDIDWASEYIIENFLNEIPIDNLKLTCFVTHHSEIIRSFGNAKKIDLGIHPNFMPTSNQGKSSQEIIENLLTFAPEAIGYRNHRLYEVSDIKFLLKDRYQMKYSSNVISLLKNGISPFYNYSGNVEIPIFYEDGTHLHLHFPFEFVNFSKYFETAGLKVISIHPMNYMLNPESKKWMRSIKDNLTFNEYNNINSDTFKLLENKGIGIRKFILEIFQFVFKNNYKVIGINEVYHEFQK